MNFFALKPHDGMSFFRGQNPLVIKPIYRKYFHSDNIIK